MLIRQRLPATLLILLLAVTLLCADGMVTCAKAQAITPSDTQVKAAMIYNLAKFVEWPHGTFAGNDTPLTVCWLGSGTLSRELHGLEGKLVKNRPVTVRQASRFNEIGDCQILVIDASAFSDLDEILQATGNKPVFTISDMPDFAMSGGMLGFVGESGKVRFQVNLDAVKAAHLTISAQVLHLATIVSGGSR